MKNTGLFFFLTILMTKSEAQFYYNEQILTRQVSQKQQLTASAKVYSIDFSSYDGEGQIIEGLKTQQKYRKDFMESTTISSIPSGSTSYSRSLFDKQYRLIQQTDSGEDHKNVTSYFYDVSGKISRLSIINQSVDGFVLQEEHYWKYDIQGHPSSLLKVKNQQDSTFIQFVLDEKGNVIEENGKRKGVILPTIYYYYDVSGRLTDVVRYNQAVKKLLPDYIFEYNDRGSVSTMIVIPEGSSEYQKWYYVYDNDGLKQLDACYSKDKQLIGKIEYQYKYYE